ncbi:MAG: translation initiation factor IF-2 [Candidatus Merdivicinus sp.]|jgi:translation initiation factor IF-2
MTLKYRVHEVARDLNVSKKEIIDLLDSYFGGEPRKHATALTEEELNVVFEHYTQGKQVPNFDQYFANKEKSPVLVEKAKAEAEKQAAKTAAPKAPTPKAAETKAVPAPKAPEVKAEEPKSAPIPKVPEVKVAETKPAPASKAPEAKTEESRPAPKAPEVKAEEPKPVPKTPETPKAAAPAQQSARPGFQGNRPASQNGDRGFRSDRPRSDGGNFSGGRTQSGPQNGGRPQSGDRFARPSFGNDRSSRPDSRDNRDRGGRPGQDRRTGFNSTPAKPAAPAKPPVPVVPTEPVEKERTVRHVDTRTGDVNLDKYNERYETIAPQTPGGRDNQQRKQKIKQKSQTKKKDRFSAKRETEAEKLQRLALERARKQQLKVLIPDEITVSELASRLKVTVSDVIKKLMMMGVMAAQNEVIDFDTASLVAMEYNAKIEKEVIVTIEEQLIKDEEDSSDDLVERNPVVVVMGHVDHGKTSLLDRIRNAHVTDTEAGGITQHIGAYRVKVGEHYVTFLDTPGHEAFTAMRARGAAVTDIAILVVAADDGIMPQTVEAIHHAKAAGVSIIVAINKMDKPQADPERVKQELTEYELVPEEWGGDVICVPVSAATGQGIDELLENITLVAEVQELKANPNRLAKGSVIEARLDKGRGPVATLLVQNGTLHSGDIIIAGTSVGRVRQMRNDRGQVVESAGPSIPVEITGMTEVPAAGDIFNAVEDERLARELVEQRRSEQKEAQFKSYQKVTLDNLFSQIAEGEMKELPLIVKADVQGTAEAVKQSLEKLSTDEVRVRVIHTGVGAINNSDIMLANASNAIIIGFNVRPDPNTKAAAEEQNVELRLYRIIYDAIEEVKSAMKGMLAPKTREVEMGRIEVRQVYKITNVGTVAGCYVLDGKIARNAQIRVVRDGIIIAVDAIASLKRFKDDAKEVAQGYECGVTLAKFNDIKEGDIYEAFTVEEYRD